MNRLLDIKQNFQRSLTTYNRDAFVQRQIAETLASYITRHASSPNRLLEIGCGTGFLTRSLQKWSHLSHYFLNDLNENVRPLFGDPYHFVFGNAEDCVLPDRLDAIVSASTFQWFQRLPCFFNRAFALLNSDGLLAFSTFGTNHFHEIRHLTGNGLAYFTKEELASSLSENGFRLLFSDEETTTIYFEKPLDVLRHLRTTGVNGGFQSCWSIKQYHTFASQYKERFSTEQGIPLTFHPIYMIAKK